MSTFRIGRVGTGSCTGGENFLLKSEVQGQFPLYKDGAEIGCFERPLWAANHVLETFGATEITAFDPFTIERSEYLESDAEVIFVHEGDRLQGTWVQKQ